MFGEKPLNRLRIGHPPVLRNSAIRAPAEASGGLARYNWRILFSGFTPAYSYELGRFDTRLPFDELKRQSHINQRAREADQAEDFSQRIRQGLPKPLPIDSRVKPIQDVRK